MRNRQIRNTAPLTFLKQLKYIPLKTTGDLYCELDTVVIEVSQDRFSFNYLRILPPQGYLKESSRPKSSVIFFNLKFISSMAD